MPRHFLAALGASSKEHTAGFALPTAFNPHLKSILGLTACRFATVWQKDKVKIKSERPKSRFRAFLAKKRKRVTIFIGSGWKRFLEPLRSVRLAESVERYEVAKSLFQKGGLYQI